MGHKIVDDGDEQRAQVRRRGAGADETKDDWRASYGFRSSSGSRHDGGFAKPRSAMQHQRAMTGAGQIFRDGRQRIGASDKGIHIALRKGAMRCAFADEHIIGRPLHCFDACDVSVDRGFELAFHRGGKIRQVGF